MELRRLLLLLFFCGSFMGWAQVQQPATNLQIEEHDHGAEHLFSNFNILNAVDQAGLTNRYAEESAIMNMVDEKWTEFFDSVYFAFEQNPSQVEAQFEELTANFVANLTGWAAPIPKNKDIHEVPKVINGPCVNMDFETGNLTGWTATMATRTSATVYDFSGAVAAASAAQCAIVAPGPDPNIPAFLNRVGPGGGAFAVRLGSSSLASESRAVRLEQTFLVDNFNKYFTYNYAVVFEAPDGHATNERPYFICQILDQNGAQISCATFAVVVDAASSGDFVVLNDPDVNPNPASVNFPIFYKDWSSVFTNLSAYVGQNVTVRFQVGDCSLGAHQAYAYINASCAFQTITAAPGSICQGQTTTLTAPTGEGMTYLWNTGATTQSIVTGTAGNYVVTLTPPQGSLCTADLDINVTVNPNPVANFTSANACLGNPVTFSSTSTIANPGVIASYQWNFGDGVVTPASTGTILGVSNTSGTYTNPVHTYTAAGTYNVTLTVTTTDGCTHQITIPRTIYPAVTLSRTITNVLCNGGNTGAIDLTVAGGTAPFSYSWSNGAVTQDINTLTAGTYTVNVTDGNGCPASISGTVTQPLAPLALSTTQVNVLCNGGANGSIDLTVSGGTGPYTYAWSNGAVTQDISGLGQGNYSVTVTDANGCNAITNAVITQPATPVSGSTTQTNVLCFGGATGAINLTPAGGTAPYTFSWSNGASTEDISGLVAGTYTVTIHDANGAAAGCAAVVSVTITQPAAAISLSQTHVNVLCNGATTGSIDLSVAGGTAPYTYAWSNGAITQDLTGIAAGTYTVVVTDANGSTGGCTATLPVTVTQPAAALTLATTQTNVLCNGGVTGAINLTVSGGTAPYTYSWSNGAVTEDLSGLAAGTYNVTVHDANGSTGGCAATTTVTITQPAAALTLSESHVNVLCNGGLTGSIDLTPAGGTAPYTYSWSNGATTQDLSALAAGTYTVTVHDANGSTGGCAATLSVTITQPAAALSLSQTHVNVLCNGGLTGSVDLTVSGGTAPYTYSWSNGATTQDLSGIAAGTYTVTVNDANGSTGGCAATLSVTVTQPAAALSLSSTQTNILCNGGNTGAINLTVAGGTAPYSYSWSNGAVTEDLASLVAGTYTVVVSDANGSTGGCTATTTVTITQPAAAISLTESHVNVVCNGGLTGSIDLTVAGGTAPYTYSWSNGATTQDLGGIAAGTYTVTVHDANGSSGGCNATLTVTITQPAAPLTLTETHVNLLCNGGTTGLINLTPSGGTAPYTYAWSNGATTEDIASLAAGTYTVVVSDANGSTGGCTATISVTITQPLAALSLSTTQTNILCNGGNTGAINLTVSGGTAPYSYSWSNGSVVEDLSSLVAGSYTVVVNDANGSTGGCTATTTVTIAQPAAPLTLTESHVNVLCNGGVTGSIDITPAGGTAPYTYSWSNGATTQDLGGVGAGTYTVTVHDANGTTGGCNATLTVTITQPAAPLTLTETHVNILCNGGSTGSIDLTPAGGTSPYSYLWNTGAVTQDLTNIPAGSYTVVVNDANGSTGGCTATMTVIVTQPSNPVAVSTTQTNVLCNGGTTGAVNLTVTGGTTPYAYSWSNGAVTEDLTNLPAGTYSVVVTDANGSTGGCTATTSVTITQPAAPLTVSTTQTNVLCNGAATGSIDLTPAGGSVPYSYTWSNGATTQDIGGLTAGTYTVVVNDVNGSTGGCTATTTVTITQPTALSQNVTSPTFPSGNNISCFGLSDGNVDLTIGGGVSPYSYAWSNGAATEDLTNIPSGNYSVVVTDANGCTINSSIVLTQPTQLSSVSAPSVYGGGFNVSGCVNDGTINLTVNGGSPVYNYSWSNGAVTEDLSNLAAGTYSYTVSDVNGCQTTGSLTLTAPPAMSQSITAFTYPSGTNISCFGLSDGNIDLTVNGGAAPYTYAWNNGATSQDLPNVPAGSYNVTVTDQNGCQVTANITLTEPAQMTTNLVPSIYAGGFNVTGCTSDGTIDLTVAGGNPGYTYGWSNGAATEDLASLVPGTYTILITDINGCQVSDNITLTAPIPLTESITATSFPSGTNISCFGLSDGNIDLTVAGGVAPYTYLWNTGATTEDLNNVPAGNYGVTITDDNGCVITSSINLTEPPVITNSITSPTFPSGDNISCFGLSDGNIDLSVGGGNPAYTYSWNTGATSQDLNNVPAGTYTVTVTDVNGCSFNTNITLTEPTQMTQGISSPTFPSGDNISCFSLSDGSVDLTVNGGVSPYVYVWSNGASTQDLTSITAGTYNVTITDINGCQLTNNITLTEPTQLTQTISTFAYPSGNNISCFGLSDGSVDLTINGGSPLYSYAWSNGATTQDLTNIPAGTYNVTMTDINGCQLTNTTTLTEPTPLNQGISAQIYPSGNNISCFGLSDGNIDLNVNGGSPAFSYLWNTGATTQDLANVPVGTYNVTITDVNGCSITSSITLTEPTVLTSGLVPSIYAGGFNVSGCVDDGTIDLTVTGGSPVYSFAWNTGSTNEDLSNLPIGSYDVTVTDVNGCTTTSNITLTGPVSMTSSVTAFVYPSGDNISCFGLSDGSIDLTINDGVAPYAISWSNGATTEDLTNVPAGTYNVTITDANGCLITNSITLVQPTGLTQGITAFVYPSGDNISCFGLSDGSVDLTIGGGSPVYSFAWNNGALTEDLTNVPAGTYDVLVTDVNGCTIPSTITLIEPTQITSALTPSVYAGGFNVSGCVDDGTIDLIANGGSPVYTYAWNTGSTNEDLTNLPAGTYDVTVTDVNGCTTTSSITLTAPPAMTIGVTAFVYPSGDNISCFSLSDGSIDLTITDGVAPYVINWSNGSSSEDLTNITAGTYNVTVTDANGCQQTTSITLTQPAALTQGVTAFIYPSGDNISCFGLSDGSVDLTIGGGSPVYSYAWNNGALTEDLTNVPAGTYDVLVTDVNGCTIPSTITLVEPSVLTSGLVPSIYAGGFNVSGCVDDGTIDLTVNGGSPVYTFAWNTGSTNEDLTNLPAGTYDVTATDVNGCTTTSNITLTAPPSVTTSVTAFVYPSGDNISCFSLSDGSIDLTVTDGVAPYTYNWSNGGVTEDLSNVPAGTYDVTVTDANGCQATNTITLVQPTALTQGISAFTYPSGDNISCFGLSDGSIDLTIGGGSPIYSYLWNTSATTEDITNLPAGTYDVVVTDINGCQIPSTITLVEPTPLAQGITSATYASGDNISCNGFSDGSVDLTISGGSPGYTYVWSNGDVTEDLFGIPAGTYDVLVTDINGCTIPSTITLIEPTVINPSVVLSLYAGGYNVTCQPDGFIDLTVVDGSPGYTYLWDNGAVTEDINNLAAGTYNVTITDLNGCVATIGATLVSSPTVTTVTAVTTDYNGEDITCFGASDGGITVTPAGGAPAYSYAWTNSAGASIGLTQNINNLPTGWYFVTVTDLNSCSAFDSVFVSQPTAYTTAIAVNTDYNGQDISCFGSADGGIDLTVTGATPTYSFAWVDQLNNTVSNTEDPFGLAAGTYTVTITDLNGCTTTLNQTLVEPPIIGGTTAVTAAITCFGASDGAVTATGNGGTPGYTYAWEDQSGTNLSNTQALAGLSSGIYNAIITDINGCVVAVPVTLNEPAQMNVTLNVLSNYFGNPVSCPNNFDGIVDVAVTGGTPNYLYAWNGGATSTESLISTLGEGVNSVEITDANGCQVTTNINLTANPLPTYDLPPYVYGCQGMAISIASNTEAGNNCQWVFSDGTVINDCGPTWVNFGNTAACYDAQLTITSPVGCATTAILQDFACVVPNPVASFTPSTIEVDETNNEVFFTNTSIGADEYIWNFGDGSLTEESVNTHHSFDVFNDQGDSVYYVTLTAFSEYGCVDSTIRQITVHEAVIYYVPNTFTPDNDEHNNSFKPVFSSGYDPYKGYTLLIFNRWGELVFESHDPEVGWDGTYGTNANRALCQDGTYTWKLTFKRDENDDKITDVGHVNLIR